MNIHRMYIVLEAPTSSPLSIKWDTGRVAQLTTGFCHHLNRPLLSPLGSPKLTSDLQRGGIDLARRVSPTGGLRKRIATTTRGCRADGCGRALPTVAVKRQRSCVGKSEKSLDAPIWCSYVRIRSSDFGMHFSHRTCVWE